MYVNNIRSKDVGYKSNNSDENEKKSGKFSDNNDYLDIWRVFLFYFFTIRIFYQKNIRLSWILLKIIE